MSDTHNIHYYVLLNHERSRWWNYRNDLPQGSVLFSIRLNIYTNDQLTHRETHNFIYTDDMRVTTQHPSFKQTEDTIGDAMGQPTQYYRNNSLRANPEKTQVTAFHIRYKEAERTRCKLEWNGLENTVHPKHLGVTLDRTLSYKKHITRR